MDGKFTLFCVPLVMLCKNTAEARAGRRHPPSNEVVTRGQISPSPAHFTAATQEKEKQACSAWEGSGGDGWWCQCRTMLCLEEAGRRPDFPPGLEGREVEIC